ncbi:MAG TPA: MaoC family dehydratase [Candidatus Lustribacter sp.]|nr:MaoC family dehydratase [Candidatus Lustribacter sp.]
MTGRYFEEFTVGSEITSQGQTLTLESIIAFATLYDPQSFHIDVEAAKTSPYGGLIASGFQTLAVGFRMFLDTGVLAGTSLGSPAMDELRWTQPVRPGDTLHAQARVIEARPSVSKPDRGIVRAAFRVINQRNEIVLTFSTAVFVRRRPPS